MYSSFAYMYVCAPSMYSAHGDLKRALNPLELKFHGC